MPRLPRIHVEEGLYFVSTKGDHGEKLFRDDEDRQQYLELLAKYKEQYRFNLFAYVLMPTSVYLLIELAAGTNISEIMHVINSTYIKYFNGRHQRRGHLFEERFVSILVEKELYLQELTRYIHLLPKENRLTEKAEDYKWSSYQSYLNKPDKFLDIERNAKEVLDLFSTNQEEQLALYKEFMVSASKDRIQFLKKKVQRSGVLGSKEFVENIKKMLKEESKKKEKAWVESKPHKIFVTAGSITVLILLVLTFYFYRTNLGLKTQVTDILQTQEIEIGKKIVEERKKIRQDLEEKHRADMVSYKAMAKRLELEKKKAKELEEKLEEGE